MKSRILESSCLNRYLSVGLAAYPKFVSNPAGREPNTYLLEWTVQSHTTISKFALQYREHGHSQWKHIEVKPTQVIGGMTHAGKRSLSGLKVATRYEARVKSYNDMGWSRLSPVFNFATFGIGTIGLISSSFIRHDVSATSEIQQY